MPLNISEKDFHNEIDKSFFSIAFSMYFFSESQFKTAVIIPRGTIINARTLFILIM